MKDNKEIENHLIIRNILEDDIKDILTLQTECSLSPWSAIDYHNEVKRSDSLGLIAKYDEQTAGFIIMRSTVLNEAEIYNIAINEKYRKTGIGKKLLEEAICQAKAKNKVKHIWLEVRESNQNAADFYRKQGFTAIGQRKNFYANPIENALLFKLEC